MKLLMDMCNKIDRMYGQFVWGSSNSRRKCYLINWEKVTRLKEEGGLGLWKAREVNLAYMMKLAWGIIYSPNKLSIKVMRNKYKWGKDLIPDIKGRSKVSNAGRGCNIPYFAGRLGYKETRAQGKGKIIIR